jgi:hypothetical protein
MNTKPPTLRLDQLPLWRLLVALADAEHVAGPNSGTARVLAREVRRRLSTASPNDTAEEQQTKGGNRG